MDASLGTAMGTLGLNARPYTSAMDQAQRASDQFFQNNVNRGQAMAQDLQQVGIGVAGIGAVVTGAFGMAIKSAADFEAGVNAVQAVSDPAAWVQYGDAIESTALRLGKDYPASAQEAIAVMEELAKQGISLENITNGAAEGVVLLANATGTDFVTSAEIAATTMNQFGYEGDQMIDVANILTAAANESATSVEGMGAALSFVGNQAALLGVPLEDVATAISIASQRGIDGAKAGTALRAVFANISKDSGAAAKAMNEFGLGRGQAFELIDSQTGQMHDFEEVLRRVTAATEGMTASEKSAALTRMFNTPGANLMLSLMANQEEALNGTAKGWDDYRAAIESNGQAETAASIRMKGLAGAVELFSGAMDALKVKVGNTFLPVFEGIVRTAANVIDKIASLPDPILRVVSVLGALTGAAALMVGGLMVASPVLLSTAMAMERLKAAGGVAKIFDTLRTSVRSAVPAMEASAKATATQATAAQRATLANKGLATSLKGVLMAARPLFGVVAIGVGAWAAWSNNFLGIRDAAASLGRTLGQLKDYFVSVITTGETVGKTFVMLPNFIRPVAQAIGTLLAPFGELVEMWNWLGDVGKGGGETPTTEVAVDTTQVVEAEAQLDRFVKHTMFEDGTSAEVLVEVDEAGVERAWGKVIDRVESADGLTATVTIEGDSGPYDVVVDAVTGQVIPDKTTTLTADMQVTGDDKVIEWVANPDALDGTGFDYMVRIKNPDGSLGEFGQIIESYTDETNPNLVHMKVKTDDGEYWTTYDDITDTWGEWEPDPVTFTADGSLVEQALADQEAATVGTLDRMQTSLGAFQNKANEMDMPFLSSMAEGLITVVGWIETGLDYLGELQGIYEAFSGGTDAGTLENGDLVSPQGFSVMRGVSAVVDKLVEDFPALGVAISVVKGMWDLLGKTIAVVRAIIEPLRPIFAYMINEWGPPLMKVAGLFVGLRVGVFALQSVFGGFMLILKPFIGIFNMILGPFTKLIPLVSRLGPILMKVATGGVAMLIKGVVALNAAILANPIVALIAGLVLLGVGLVVLYKKWEPFRKLVDATAGALMKFVVKPVVEFLKDLGGWIKDAYSWFKKLTKPLRDATVALVKLGASKVVNFFKDLFGILKGGAFAVLDFVRGFSGIQDAFSGVDRLINAVRATVGNFFTTLSTRFPALSNVIEYFGRVVDRAMSAVQDVLGVVSALLRGDFSDAWEHVKSLAETIFDGFVDAFTSVPGMLADIFTSIPWGDIGGAILDGLQAAWDFVKNGAGDLWGWLADTVSSVDWWGIVETLASAAWGALQGLGGLIATAAGNIWDWIKDLAFDWYEGVTSLLSTAGDALSGLGGKIAEAAGNVWDWITEQVTNLSIAGAVLTLLGKGRDMLEGLWSGISGVWNDTIKPWFGNIAEFITAAFPDLGPLLQMGVKLMTKIYDGISQAWTSVTEWFKGIPDRIFTAVSSVMDGIKGIGSNVIDWIIDGLEAAWGGVEDFFAGAWDKIKFWEDDEAAPVDTGGAPVQAAASQSAFDGGKVAQNIADAIGAALPKVNTAGLVAGLEGMFAAATVSPEALAASAQNVGQQFLFALARYFDGSGSGAQTGKTLALGIEHAFWIAGDAIGASLDDDADKIGHAFMVSLGTYFSARTEGGTLATGIAGAFAKAAGPAVGLFTAPANAVGEVFARAMQTYFTSVASGEGLATGMQAWVDKAVSVVTPLFAEAAKVAGEGASLGAAQGVLNRLKVVLEAVKTWDTQVVNQRSTIKASGTLTGQTVSLAVAQGMMDRITNVLNAVKAWNTQITNQATTIKRSATNLGQDASTQVAQGMLNKLRIVTTAAEKYVKQVRDQVPTMKAYAMGMGQDASVAVREGIDTYMDRVRGGVDKFIEVVRNRAQSMYDNGLYMGEMGGAGVAQGLLNYVPIVRTAADTIIRIVDEAMRKAGEVRSPSGMTEYIGEMLTLGVPKGMLAPDALAKVRAAGTTVMNAVRESLDGALDVNAVSMDPAVILGERLAAAIAQGLGHPAEAMLAEMAAARMAGPSGLSQQVGGVAGRSLIGSSVINEQIARVLGSTRNVVPASPQASTAASTVNVNAQIVLQGVDNPRMVADQLVGILESVSTQQRARTAANF